MNQNWRYIFPKKLEHFKALIVNNKSKATQTSQAFVCGTQLRSSFRTLLLIC